MTNYSKGCCVEGCKQPTTEKRMYFRIPAGTDTRGRPDAVKMVRRQRWLEIINVKKLEHTKDPRICSKHFISGKPAADSEHPDWVPNQNMGKDGGDDNVEEKVAVFRKKAAEKKHALLEDLGVCLLQLKQKYEVPSTPTVEAQQSTSAGMEVCESTVSSGSTDTTASSGPSTPESRQQRLPFEFVSIQQDRKRIKLEKIECPSRLLNRLQMQEEEMTKDPKMVQYLTGLKNVVFIREILKLVAPCLTHRTRLTFFQELMLTLVKFRLDIEFTFLGFQFNINSTIASQIFYKWVDILFAQMKQFIRWPEREELQALMPPAFEVAFGKKYVIILDCFEILIEKPENPELAALTWSNYKHHHTIKVLIGITPQGHIAFVSKVFVGGASDTFVTENCGILNNLLPGDVVLADRGFSIQDSVKMYAAELHKPSFLKGKKQLKPKDVEGIREIANVRKHVELMIGLVRRKYKILSGILPSAVFEESTDPNITTVGKIITVCCALVTNSEKIV